MDLFGEADAPRLVTRTTGIDHTDRVSRWAGGKLAGLEKAGLCGFVFKARSPSCGVHDTKLYSRVGQFSGRRAGIFAEAVMRRFPLMPVEDEEGLRDPSRRERFIERVFVFHSRYG